MTNFSIHMALLCFLLSLPDNEFICDCRLAWIFDLRNRTQNFELKYSLEEIECSMKTKERLAGVRVKVNPNDVLRPANDGVEYYDDESYEEKAMTQLVQIKQKELPCPHQYREQFEHPSTREFIGIDISSWIGSPASAPCNPMAVLFLALITHFACAHAAFFR
jgi:hypothetical protein